MVVVSVEVVSDALCGLSDDIDVHAVCADAKRAAQASSAKVQVTVERVIELLFIAWLHKLVKLCLEICFGDIVHPKPSLSFNLFVHTCPFASCRLTHQMATHALYP